MVFGVGLIWGIVMGGLSGFLAGKVMKEKGGIIKNILLGILGGIVGGFLFHLIGFQATTIFSSLIVSVIGACICIWLGRKFFK
ncbi:MAG: GlsB/YeaQ/YmgE family stress response membrane protein [Butyrivibrio sp.]|nr:GlsB/YeaQ/YmgE family stress response membrane protein [Butyrivibrio sp.]